LGIILSANAMPFLNVFSRNAVDPFQINSEVYDRLLERKSWMSMFPPVIIAVVFIQKFMERMHGVICSDKQLKRYAKAADISSKTMATALAVWIAQEFGISHPVAIAVAVGVILIVIHVGRDAFCDEEVVSMIREAVGEKSD
jgi:hypothetical protein